MLASILSFVNSYKFWILLVLSAITIFVLNKSHQKTLAKKTLELQAIISQSGNELLTCKRDFDLCDANFKSLAKKCRTSCPGLSSDIEQMEKDYEAGKKKIAEDQKKIDDLLGQIKKLKEEQIASGNIVWAKSPEELEKQLKNLLGDKWQLILDQIKKDSGISGITSMIRKFRYYPKAKLSIGTDLNQVQGQVGVSFFSYGRDRSIEKTVFDFVEPFISVGMNSDGKVGVGIGLIPISLNLGGVLPVVKDLDVFAGAQFNVREQSIVPVVGIGSTF